MQDYRIIYTNPQTLDEKILKTTFNKNVATRDLPMYQRAHGKDNVRLIIVTR